MYKKLEAFQESKLWRGVYAVNGYLISFCGVALTCVIFAGVIMRYIFKRDFFGSEEIILLFAWWMYFLGGIGGSQEDSQIKAIILGLEDKSIPAVMKYFTTNYDGKVDMGLVSKIARSL